MHPLRQAMIDQMLLKGINPDFPLGLTNPTPNA